MVFYKESSVIALEPVEWIHGVNKAGFLNLPWVSHYHCTLINVIFIKKLLCLVHDACLWLGETIPITDRTIPRITLLLHFGLNPAKAFGGKTSECDLTKKIKDKFKLVKMPCKYSISSITNPVVKVATQILAGKISQKCCTDKVPTPVVSLVA